MISKLRFSLIAVTMLVLFGFGLQNEAKAQAENVFCPGIPNTAGWLDLAVSSASSSFSAGLIGTVEGTAVGAVGGIDWLHADFTNIDQPFPTNTLGAQIVSWWTQAADRATVLQVTNAFPDGIAVHVRIYGSNCQELTNFCDFYTGGDTHAYDFSDLIDNNGIERNDIILQGTEGFVVVTAVDDCPSSDVAVDYNGLAATTYVLDGDGYEYGVNAYHRAGVCFDVDEPATANLVDNGTFETGPGSVPEWVQVQGTSSVVEASNISPAVNPPLCDDPADPECDAPNANRFMAFVASSSDTATGAYGSGALIGSITSELAAVLGAGASDLIGTGVAETNVTVLESNIFTPGTLNDGFSDGIVSYQLALLTGGEECDQYAMVCTINVTGFPTTDPSFEDCDCYTFTGNGTAPASLTSCSELSTQNTTGVDAPDLPAFNFATRSGFVSGSLVAPVDGSSYVVQVITGEKVNCIQPDTVGAFVDNFRIIEEFNLVLECDGILTGAENAFLTSFTPSALAGQFSLLPGSDAAGADVVLINFQDSYGPPYQPVAAFAHYSPIIYDDFETPNSCGQFDACYARLGIDDSIIDSDDFTPVGPTTTPPTITPTVPPTITPTVPPTTPPVTPTPTGSGSGGGSCAIAGSPVQLGTALANVLIPLVPVAFAFGVRRLRRKK